MIKNATDPTLMDGRGASEKGCCGEMLADAIDPAISPPTGVGA